jgi:sugar (pentulose or hexulose) kinase
MADRFVAFDLGAESGRALVGNLDGGKLTLDEKHRFPNPTGKMSGHLHWNLLQQWEELKTGLRNAGKDGAAIAGIGVDTWGVDFGLLAKDGAVLGNPYMYRDSITDGIMDRTFRVVDRQRLFDVTGIQFMQFNSVFQLRALAEHKAAVLDSADKLLFMPDLFHYLFSGVARNEVSIASTSQMLDPRTRQWARPLLEELKIPTRILCDIVPAGTVLGELSTGVAAECGVGRIPVIAPASHDTASAVAAVPAASGAAGNWCYISSGTWSLMGVELEKPVITEKSLRYNYTNELGVANTVRFLKNIMGLWLVQECRRHFKSQGHDLNYAELTAMAHKAEPLVAMIDPDHGPFGKPGEIPLKIEAFCRQTKQRVPSSQGEFIRTCLESLALTYRRTLAGLEDIIGRKIEVIHIVGGGTQNTLLNQMTADACGRTVIAGPIEATAIGNILVQAMAVGKVKSLDDARRIVRDSFDVKRYEPADRAKWDEAYKRYEAIVGQA